MVSLDEVVTELREVLARIENIDLWPPWDAVGTVVDAVAVAVRIATEPPAPDPRDVDAARAEWRGAASATERACDDLRSCRTALTPAVWEGSSGDTLRTSLTRLRTRTATVPVAASAVARALETLSGEMASARSRHAGAFDRLSANLQISWSNLTPWGAYDYLSGIVAGIVSAVRDLIGAYSDASGAVKAAQREIGLAMDEITLPDRLPRGADPVALVNEWEDEDGPLSGAAMQKFDDMYARLGAADRSAVDAALAGARSDQEAAWILAGVASGLTGQALANYLARLRGMSAAELDALAPPTDGSYSQPDQTTCGSSSLVMSRMLNDPAYAMWMETGYDPVTGRTDPRTPEERFADESLEMHRRTNGLTDRDQDLQVPWPESLGTAPWGLANEMSAAGGSGVPGATYGVETVSPGNRGETYDHIASSVENGHTVPLYVGDDTRPGHVVLVTGSDASSLTIYDPATGQTHHISRGDFTNGTMGVSGWDEPWFAVTPE